jgi:hypothetical protein
VSTVFAGGPIDGIMGMGYGAFNNSVPQFIDAVSRFIVFAYSFVMLKGQTLLKA